MFDEEPIIQVLDPVEEFYSKKLYFSYSALKLLLWSPAQYKKKYIDKQYEDKLSANLLEGKVIHCLMLNNHMFESQFIVSPTNLPSGNTKTIVDRVFKIHQANPDRNPDAKLDEYSNDVISILLEINLHQSLTDDKKADAEGNKKTGDQKRLEKVITDEARNYFDYLKQKGNRDVIDQETYDKCKAAADVLLNHTHIRMLMGFDDYSGTLTVINETEFRVDLERYPFGLKGIIDNMVIDKYTRVIRVNDLKTTGKSITEFKDSIEFFQYWLQAVIYCIIVYRHFADLFDKEGYRLEFRFIVIDNLQQVYPFKVTEKTLSEWTERAEELLRDAEYHYSQKSYNLPVLYEKNLVEL